MARVLITGIGGFAGSHLAEYLLSTTEDEVWGIIHHSQWRLAEIEKKLHLLRVDLTDPIATLEAINIARPDKVYHLAGQADVGQAWTEPWRTYKLNLRTQLNILESIVALKLQPAILLVTSNLVYGQPRQLPLDESAPLQPDTPYGVSKAAQDLMGRQYVITNRLHIVRARPFNHIGPRQAASFVVPAFAEQVARIEAGLQEPVIRVGNLSARRDFSDVRDIVRAYYLLAEKGRPGEAYNVGSGHSHTIREVLDILLTNTPVPIREETDPQRLRPSDIPDLYGNNEKLHQETGWRPQISFQKSVLDVLAEWRERVASRQTSLEEKHEP